MISTRKGGRFGRINVGMVDFGVRGYIYKGVDVGKCGCAQETPSSAV